jgi:spore protease
VSEAIRLFAKRTDLALEARELWQESAEKTTRLSGVKAAKEKQEGYPVTRVDILDRRGADALGKPQGSYLTIDLTTFWQRKADFFERAVRVVGGQLKSLLPAEGPVLVVGLGNRSMTPDAVGPLAADSVLVTRHLVSSMPKHFSGFRPVAVCRTGVLGTTGVESAEAVRGLAAEVRPALVIAIDALAARRRGRVCSTVQLSDTGIIPGSGVGNHRWALDRETLGVPVISIGVPTVVDAATLAADLLEEAGMTAFDEETLRRGQENLMVTPRDIDAQVRDLSKVVGYGINWALQDLEIEEIAALLS